RHPPSGELFIGERRHEPSALTGPSHGTAVCGPACTVVWEGRSREASPYPDPFDTFRVLHVIKPAPNVAWTDSPNCPRAEEGKSSLSPQVIHPFLSTQP